MRASVVMIMVAIEVADVRAVITTLVGSMIPRSTRLPYSSVTTSKPSSPVSSATLLTTTAPSSPALAAICLSGAESAWRTTRAPARASPSSLSASMASRARIRATPPPATQPSSRAARVAWRASSTRALRSFISTSVAAPTLIWATPPTSRASRSCSFSRSQSESVSSICWRISSQRASMALRSPPPPTTVVSSLVTVTRSAVPRWRAVTPSRRMPTSSLTTVAPVRAARSWSIALRRSPKPGALMATAVRVPRMRLTTRVASASAVTSSATMSRGCLAPATSSSTGSRSRTALILESVMRMAGWSSSATISFWSVTRYAET